METWMLAVAVAVLIVLAVVALWYFVIRPRTVETKAAEKRIVDTVEKDKGKGKA